MNPQVAELLIGILITAVPILIVTTVMVVGYIGLNIIHAIRRNKKK